MAAAPKATPGPKPLRESGGISVVSCSRKGGGGWVAVVRWGNAGEREVVSREGVRWFCSDDGSVVTGTPKELLEDEADYQEALRSVGQGRKR
jgi:hypothetical protein